MADLRAEELGVILNLECEISQTLKDFRVEESARKYPQPVDARANRKPKNDLIQYAFRHYINTPSGWLSCNLFIVLFFFEHS